MSVVWFNFKLASSSDGAFLFLMGHTRSYPAVSVEAELLGPHINCGYHAVLRHWLVGRLRRETRLGHKTLVSSYRLGILNLVRGAPGTGGRLDHYLNLTSRDSGAGRALATTWGGGASRGNTKPMAI